MIVEIFFWKKYEKEFQLYFEVYYKATGYKTVWHKNRQNINGME